jgi:drug/metabolite transporter (DMT)-like permease
MELIGQLAALGTAISFSFGSTLFTLSGRMIGSPLVNRARLLVAFLFVLLIHWVTFGQPLPLDAGVHPWFWLGMSGFVGLALGDAFLFQGFVMVGPRLSMLVMALHPVIGAFLAWAFLDEQLLLREVIGIALTISGIAWVVLERPARKAPTGAKIAAGTKRGGAVAVDNTRAYIIGLLFAFGGAVGQAGGNVLSKIGLENDFPAFSGLIIRVFVAMLLVWALSALSGKVVSSVRTLRKNPRALLMLTGGAIAGPVIGVWLSLVAVQNAPIGIASALMALTPIFLLPISYIVFGERISRQAVIGTFIAFAGTLLLL